MKIKTNTEFTFDTDEINLIEDFLTFCVRASEVMDYDFSLEEFVADLIHSGYIEEILGKSFFVFPGGEGIPFHKEDLDGIDFTKTIDSDYRNNLEEKALRDLGIKNKKG